MRTPTQRAASRGPKTGDHEPRHFMDARALERLTEATVLTIESREDFRELVREQMLRIAPRNVVEQDFVEQICSAAWRLVRARALERKTIALEHEAQSRGWPAARYRRLHLFLQRQEAKLQRMIEARSPASGKCASSAKDKNPAKPPHSTVAQPPGRIAIESLL